ncbi:hypothetical protein ABIE71_006919 [Bradyrhizobium diazoefficiens]
MTIRPLVRYPDRRLAIPARPVTAFDDELRELAADLLDTMRAAPGIGITAPHIGVPLRVVVLELDAKDGARLFATPSSPLPAPFGDGSVTTLPLAARDLGRQRVQLRLPEIPELTDPRIHRAKPRNVDRIEPPLRLRPNRREAALAQHLEVLRHGGLRDSELRPDRLDDLAGRHFPGRQQLEDATAHGIGEDLEDVHQLPVPGCATSGGISPR